MRTAHVKKMSLKRPHSVQESASGLFVLIWSSIIKGKDRGKDTAKKNDFI